MFIRQDKTIEKGKYYHKDYFLPYEQRITHPATIANNYSISKYDYKMLGILYNVHTIEINGLEKVTSIWDRTSGVSLERLVIEAKGEQKSHN